MLSSDLPLVSLINLKCNSSTKTARWPFSTQPRDLLMQTGMCNSRGACLKEQ